jgi:hypothetical protein
MVLSKSYLEMIQQADLQATMTSLSTHFPLLGTHTTIYTILAYDYIILLLFSTR